MKRIITGWRRPLIITNRTFKLQNFSISWSTDRLCSVIADLLRCCTFRECYQNVVLNVCENYINIYTYIYLYLYSNTCMWKDVYVEMFYSLGSFWIKVGSGRSSELGGSNLAPYTRLTAAVIPDRCTWTSRPAPNRSEVEVRRSQAGVLGFTDGGLGSFRIFTGT